MAIEKTGSPEPRKVDAAKPEELKKDKHRIEVSTEKTVSRAGKIETSMKESKEGVAKKGLFGRSSETETPHSA